MAEAFTNRALKGSTLTSQDGDDLFSPQFSQSAHGLAVGDVVRRSSATDHVKAQAESEANVGVGLSLVVHTPDGNTLSVLRAGNSHAVVIGSHGLGSFGAKLWLSQGTAGLITATEPPTGILVYLGYVINSTTIHWEPGLRAMEV